LGLTRTTSSRRINIAMGSRQVPALDGVRGIAIFAVVLHNATGIALAPSSRWLHVFPLFSSRGWIGVQLFFALSGFLITAGLLDSQQARHYFRNFYAKRALRILPLYYSVLLVLLVVLPHFIDKLPYSLDRQAPLWLFIGNWTKSFPYGFTHFWSLAIEEQFYLVWPLLVWKLAAPRLLSACLWITLGALLLRCVLAALGIDWWTIYSNTACRMDALALGGAAACVLRIPALHEAACKRQSQLLGGALLVFLAGVPLTHIYDNGRWTGETLGYSMLAVSSSAFVLWAAMSAGRAASGVARLLNFAPLRSVGRYSYAIYVFHNLLHQLVGEPLLSARFGKLPPLPIVFLYAIAIFAASYAAAVCSYHGLEKHFLKLKRFFGGG
jgi:peptidoglycan/LPS O-acetylase OafA/YrhL